MRKSWILVAALMVGSPAWAVAQGEGDPETRIADAMAKASSAGIPTALLNVSNEEATDALAQAAELRLSHLLQAQQALTQHDGAASAEELSAGANLIGVGVSQAAITAIDAGMPPGDRSVALAVLYELHYNQKIDVYDAYLAVMNAGQQGMDAVANLPAQARAGQLPEAASIRGRPDWAGPAGVGGVPAGAGARPPVANPRGRP